MKLEIIEKSGSWFSYNSVRIGQGRENVKQYLKDNPKISNEIEKLVREKSSKATNINFEQEEEVND